MRSLAALLLVPLVALHAADVLVKKPHKQIINVSASPHVKFRTIGLNDARWAGGFWGERWERNYRVTIPTMKQVMELPTNSATFYNLRVAAGETQGKFFGNNWGDGRSEEHTSELQSR